MATRSTSLSFLFLLVIHLDWVPLSISFCPSSPYINLPRTSFTTTFTRSRLFSSDPDLNESNEGDDSVTYYSPNVPLKNKFDIAGNDDEYFLADDASDVDLGVATAAGSESEYSFFDEAIIQIRAGSGGQGASTYKLMPGGMDGAPDGGSGGTGGNIILETDPTLNSLAGLTQAWRPNSFGGSGAASQSQSLRPKSFRAENGLDGDRQFKNGRFGTDIVIRVPPGTVVQEELAETIDDVETKYLFDLGSLSLEERRLTVAFGGEGGEGTGAQGKNRSIRRPRAPPTGGQRKMLKLTLKIVADVALVGVPNAGKSTFLASVTRAKPKIANVSSCGS
jgi:hypothetical protein